MLSMFSLTTFLFALAMHCFVKWFSGNSNGTNCAPLVADLFIFLIILENLSLVSLCGRVVNKVEKS
jgi:hypothetical protein